MPKLIFRAWVPVVLCMWKFGGEPRSSAGNSNKLLYLHDRNFCVSDRLVVVVGVVIVVEAAVEAAVEAVKRFLAKILHTTMQNFFY